MRFTIKTKLIGSFGAVLALLGTAGYFGISSLNASNGMMQSFASRPFVQVNSVKDMAGGIIDLRRLMFRLYLENDPAGMQKLQAEYAARWDKIETSYATFVSASDPSRQAEIADVKPALDGLRQLADKGVAMFADVNTDLTNEALVKTEALFDKLIGELDKVAGAGTIGDVADAKEAVYAGRLNMVSALDLSDPAEIAGSAPSWTRRPRRSTPR